MLRVLKTVVTCENKTNFILQYYRLINIFQSGKIFILQLSRRWEKRTCFTAPPLEKLNQNFIQLPYSIFWFCRRKSDLDRLLKLIQSMGGSVRADVGIKVTTTTCCSSRLWIRIHMDPHSFSPTWIRIHFPLPGFTFPLPGFTFNLQIRIR